MKHILLSAFAIIMTGLDVYAGSANPQKMCKPTPFQFEVTLSEDFPKHSDNITTAFFNAFVNTTRQITAAPGQTVSLYPYAIDNGPDWPFRYQIGEDVYTPGQEIEIPVNTEGWNKQLAIIPSSDRINDTKAFSVDDEDYIFVTFDSRNGVSNVFITIMREDEMHNMIGADGYFMEEVLVELDSQLVEPELDKTLRGFVIGDPELEIIRPSKAAGSLASEYPDDIVISRSAIPTLQLFNIFEGAPSRTGALRLHPAFATPCASYTVDLSNNPAACQGQASNTSTCSLTINGDGSMYYENGCCDPGYSLSIKSAQ